MDILEIGLSIIDDTRKEELLYISLTQSDVVWTESTGRRIKPLSDKLNNSLEKLYLAHTQQREIHPEDRELVTKKYPLEEFGVKSLEIVFVGRRGTLGRGVSRRGSRTDHWQRKETQDGSTTGAGRPLDGIWCVEIEDHLSHQSQSSANRQSAGNHHVSRHFPSGQTESLGQRIR